MRRTVQLLVLGALAGATVAGAAPPPAGFRIPVEVKKLANGLTVVVSEDHSAPTFGISTAFRIGFRLEPQGRTGFAHLFEHMMFEGTPVAPKGTLTRVIEGGGGILNGSTRYDYTNYIASAPVSALDAILTGSFGSRLTENIREDKGYTYSPGGGVQARAKGGLLTVRADVRTEVTAASLLEMFYELDRMGATAPTSEELSRAKRYQGGLYLLRNQIQSAVAQTLASNWVNGLPPEALGEFVTKVNAVTSDQVREAGRAYFPSAQQTVVVVGDEPKVKAELAQFGAATTVQP